MSSLLFYLKKYELLEKNLVPETKKNSWSTIIKASFGRLSVDQFKSL